jgi:hypothetical protein
MAILFFSGFVVVFTLEIAAFRIAWKGFRKESFK